MDMKYSCISRLCCGVHHFSPEDEIPIFNVKKVKKINISSLN
jgi:hypothetical protein